MMRKKLLTLALTLALVSSVTQALTVAYPSKRALKKADHITSLVMTGVLVSGKALHELKYKRSVTLLGYALFAATGANIVINGMALKHEKSPAAFLKFLLPTALLGELFCFINRKHIKCFKKKTLVKLFRMTLGAHVLKNFWDVHSLVRPQPAEDIMNGHEIAITH